MNVDIRKSIIENFKGNGKDEMIESIEESIKEKEEITLPGLGVFFELLWKQSDDDLKNTIVSQIQKSLS